MGASRTMPKDVPSGRGGSIVKILSGFAKRDNSVAISIIRRKAIKITTYTKLKISQAEDKLPSHLLTIKPQINPTLIQRKISDVNFSGSPKSMKTIERRT